MKWKGGKQTNLTKIPWGGAGTFVSGAGGPGGPRFCRGFTVERKLNGRPPLA